MLADLLTLRGQEVRTAGDGLAALETARQFRPEVVLVDLGLPVMDGYALAAELRAEHGEKVLLIAMTGYQKDADRLEQAGFDGHLLKPPDLQQLLGMLGEGGALEQKLQASPRRATTASDSGGGAGAP